MSFWDAFNASKQAYFHYINSRRSVRLSFPAIDSTLRSLDDWQREFESLRQNARSERNRTAAEGKLEEMLRQINTKRDQYLQLRYKQQERERGLQQKIDRLEESIRRIEESTRRDHEKVGRLMKRKGNAWEAVSRQIRDKERKVSEMKNSLSNLQQQAMQMHRE